MGDARFPGPITLRALILVLVLFVLTAPGRVGNTDVSITLDLARALLRGSVTLDPGCMSCAVGIDGIRTSQYGIGHSLLLVPWVVAGRAARLVGLPGGVERWEEFFVSFSNIPVIGLLLFFLARHWHFLGAGDRRMGAGVVLFGAATLLGPYARMPFSDGLLALGIFGAWHTWRHGGRWSGVWTGCWLGFALVSRRQADAVVPLLMVLLAVNAGVGGRGRSWWMTTVAILPFVGVRLAYNQARFGTPWVEVHPGLTATRVMVRGMEGGFARLPEVLWSSSEGFLVYGMVPLLIAVFGFRAMLRRSLWDAVAVVLIPAAGVAFVALLRFGPGVSFGARYLLYLIPFLGMAWPFVRVPRGNWGRIAWAIPVAFSVVVMAGGFVLDPNPVAIRRRSLDGEWGQTRATAGEWRRVLTWGDAPVSPALVGRADWGHPAFDHPDFWWCHGLDQVLGKSQRPMAR